MLWSHPATFSTQDTRRERGSGLMDTESNTHTDKMIEYIVCITCIRVYSLPLDVSASHRVTSVKISLMPSC